MKLLFKVFLFLSLYYFAQGKREETLSDHYKVEWEVNPDDDTIEFQVTVETKGFVGFGLSLTGGMPGADMIIGGVNDDGSTYFKVCSTLTSLVVKFFLNYTPQFPCRITMELTLRMGLRKRTKKKIGIC